MSAQILNEINLNPNGADVNAEFVEILGTPSTPLTGFYFASVEGDSTSAAGSFDRVFDLTALALGTNGLLFISNDPVLDTIPATTTVIVSTGFESGSASAWHVP